MNLGWWPIFGIRVVTPRVELRPFTDDMIDEYAALLSAGIHPPDEMPFSIPFTDNAAPELQRQSCQFHWRTRGNWTPDIWHLPFMVFENDRMVGQQDVVGEHFAQLRVVRSGSWLGLAYQGRGLGTEMRSAVLHFAFAGLGAARAQTEAFGDNPASIGVTRKLGYESNGEVVSLRRDKPVLSPQFVLHREIWEQQRRDDITIDGLEPALAMFGAD